MLNPYRLPLYNGHFPVSPRRPSWRSPAVICINFERDYPQTGLEVRNTLKLEEKFRSSIVTWKLKIVGHHVLQNVFFFFLKFHVAYYFQLGFSDRFG